MSDRVFNWDKVLFELFLEIIKSLLILELLTVRSISFRFHCWAGGLVSLFFSTRSSIGYREQQRALTAQTLILAARCPT